MNAIPFTKKAESLDALADKIIDRGIVMADRGELLKILSIVGYYRFSGYLFPFRLNDGTDNYQPGTKLESVWECYSFDRKLRLVAFDALSRIEVAVRTLIVRCQVEESSDNPFLYLDRKFMPGLTKEKHDRLLKNIEDAIGKSKSEPCVQHFTVGYGLKDLPVWAVMEIIPFGTVTFYYQGLPFAVRRRICDTFHVHPNVFAGWLMALKKARNLCAHHSRFWNHKIDARISLKIDRNPALADLYQCLKVQSGQNSTTLFSVLSICAYCLRELRPESDWRNRLKTLIAKYPNIPLAPMGFPADWLSFDLWK